MQYSPNIKSTESFTTTIEPSNSRNKFINILIVGFDYQVNYQSIVSSSGNPAGSVSADGKEITVNTTSGYKFIGSTINECTYILKKIN